METIDIYDLLSSLLYLILIIWILIQGFNLLAFSWSWSKSCQVKSHHQLPPGPKPFPIIGNLLELGHNPHKSLAKLSHIHGPIMSLKLGQITTIVVSSPEIAKEILQTHDQLFSNRTVPDSLHALNHHHYGLPWIPVSPSWRNFRKICSSYMFSVKALETNKNLRYQKVQELLGYVGKMAKAGEALDIGRAGFNTSLSLLSTTFFSLDWANSSSSNHDGGDDAMAKELKDIVLNIMEAAGIPNLADYFPFLKIVDPQGIRRNMAFQFKKMMGLFDRIINQRLQLLTESSTATGLMDESHDILDNLLNYMMSEENKEHKLLDIIAIEHFLVALFSAGTDTSSLILEWSMTELLKKPEILCKAQMELDKVIGKGNQMKESDITRLPYLQAIIKEIFRLHPPAPFLIPRKAESDVKICGYLVPKNAQVIVNIWAISRDPKVWDNPNEFIPERFLESNIDVKGRHFELLPFGSGRRICPGLPLAMRMVDLMLGSLIHSFDWKLEDGIEPNSVDMEEKFGLTLQKAEPLRAMAKLRM